MKRNFMLFTLLPVMIWGDFFFTGVMQKPAGYSEQMLLSRTKLTRLERSIKQGWQEGYAVTSLSHAPHKWNAVLSKGTSVTEQITMRRRLMDDFTRDLYHYLNMGFEVVEIENGVGEWIAVLQKGGSFHGTTFLITRDKQKMTKTIDTNIQQGVKPIDIEEAEGYHVIIFAKNTPFKEARYAQAANWNEVEKAVANAWKEKWNILKMVYGDDAWSLLFVHYAAPRTELYIRNKDFKKFRSSVREGWQRGLRLTDIANGRR